MRTARPRRRLSLRGVFAGALLLLVLLRVAATARGEPPAAASDTVLLRSGKVLEGRVVARTRVGDTPMLAIETDFGRILVPAADVADRGPEAGPCGNEPFAFRRVRIVDLKGRVLRRAKGERDWTPLVDGEYALAGAPWPELRPGDALRTGADGLVAFMPHKDVWIRLAPDTEVEILAKGEGASVDLRAGDLVARVTAPPAGCGVFLRTPTSLLSLREGGVVLRARDGRDSIGVKDGAVQLDGGPRLEAGSAADVRRGESAQVRSLAEVERIRGAVEATIPPPDDMVCVPQGRYELGGGPGNCGIGVTLTYQGDHYAQACNERGHTAELLAYLIDRRKVSNADYARFAAATGRKLPYYLQGATLSPELRSKPVHAVGWDDAQAYARWCGKELPSASQWEVAARGARSFRFPWGDKLGGDEQAFFNRWWGPTRVGLNYDAVNLPGVDDETLDRSPFGVVGLASPPAEWCRDLVEDTRIVFGSDPRPRPRTEHVFREMLTTRLCYPSQTDPPAFELGFRCVRELR